MKLMFSVGGFLGVFVKYVDEYFQAELHFAGQRIAGDRRVDATWKSGEFKLARRVCLGNGDRTVVARDRHCAANQRSTMMIGDLISTGVGISTGFSPTDGD